MRVCTRVYMGKLNIEFTISSFCSLYSDQQCVLELGGKLNNVGIFVTRFWSKMDLAPFGIKLFISIFFLFNSYVCVIVFLTFIIFCTIFMHGPIEKQLMLNGSSRVEINKWKWFISEILSMFIRKLKLGVIICVIHTCNTVLLLSLYSLSLITLIFHSCCSSFSFLSSQKLTWSFLK